MKYRDRDYLYEEYYLKGRFAKDIANEFNVTHETIRINIKKFGLQRRKHDWVNTKYGKSICSDYIDNKMTLRELSLKYLGTEEQYPTIKQVLVDNNIELRDKSEVKILRDEKYGNKLNGRKHDLNFDYFKTWTSDMAYTLGFIASDGNIKGTRLKISVKSSDVDVLEKIKESIKYTGDIHLEKSKCNGKDFDTATLYIHSKDLCGDLKSLNIIENKSLVLNMDEVIPNEYKIDFIRGYFDGDGSIGSMYPTNSKGIRSKKIQIRFRICSGSYDILKLVVDEFERLGIKRVNIKKSKNKQLYNIEYSTNSALRIYDLIYKEDSIYLNRKKNRFDEIKSIREKELQDNI